MPNQNRNSDFPEKKAPRDEDESKPIGEKLGEHSNSSDNAETELGEADLPLTPSDGGLFSLSGRSTPSWQIPIGVSQGNWDYVRSSSIASDYDEFLKGHPLTEADAALLAELIAPTSETVIADFGCGNGRTLLPLLQQGAQGIGVDLSLPMLSAFRDKCQGAYDGSGRLSLVQANLVELDALADDSVDVGVCMFSTLGMIQGRSNRHTFLKHVRRIVKPGGTFILHAHNLWYQLRHPGGLRWLVGHAIDALRSRVEFGDRVATYRGVRDLWIHSFRHRELKAALVGAGWQPWRWYGLRQDQRGAPTGLPWFHAIRSVGWIVECKN